MVMIAPEKTQPDLSESAGEQLRTRAGLVIPPPRTGDASLEPKIERREAALTQMKAITEGIEQVLNRDPEHWLSGMRRAMTDLGIAMRRTPEHFHPDVAEFYQRYLPQVRSVVRDLQKQKVGDLTDKDNQLRLYELAMEAVHGIAEIFTRDVGQPPRARPALEVSYHTLEALSAGRLRVEGQNLIVCSGTGSEYIIPIPQSGNIMHKGGPARLILKILAGAPEHLIESEMPFNDFDVIIKKGNVEAMREARSWGVDREGIEGADPLDCGTLLSDRDLNINCCFLTKDGIVYDDEAFESARTGKIRLVDGDRGRRSLFGNNYFTHDDALLATHRGLMRLVKTVVEDKASSFDISPRNCKVDMGVYLLVLARKWVGKFEAPELFERAYDLVKQMGQAREGEKNFFDIIERVHKDHAYFDFEGEKLNERGVVRWVGHKLSQYATRTLRMMKSYAPKSDIQVEPNDLVKKEVGLQPRHPYTLEERVSSRHGFQVEWEAYVARCRGRTSEYNELKRLGKAWQAGKCP